MAAASNVPPASQSDVIAFLSRPQTFGLNAPVERIETHISVVFLAGDHVFKLKREVRFPYLDFSTLDRRRQACEAEILLNRRTAPDLYERVAAVTREAGGTLALDGAGEAVDYVVVMRRFDQATLFDRLAADNKLDGELLDRLTDRIAEFHRGAEKRLDHGGAAGLRAVLDQNAAAFVRHGEAVFDKAIVAELAAAEKGAFAALADQLEDRRQNGFVRHCHGDLHLRNICLWQGEPTLFDAIEFSEGIACVDVGYDLAFLLMDLIRRDLGGAANRVLNRYLMRSGDLGALAPMRLFLSCRAALRAHIAADAARAVRDATARAAQLAEARAYLHLALDLLAQAPARLIAVGGLSGTGKSTLARLLAPTIASVPGAVILRSDAIRKELLGADPFARLGPEAYTPQVTGRVFAELGRRAAGVLAAGHSVIADAVFGEAAQRTAIASVARQAGYEFSGIWLDARHEILAARVAGRTKDVSDATVAVLEAQRGRIAGPSEAERADWTRVDAAGDPEIVASRALSVLGKAG